MTAQLKDFPPQPETTTPPPNHCLQARCLTGEHCGHEGSKHEEQHGEEKEAGVVEDLAGIIANIQIKQANKHSDRQMGHHPEMGQHLERNKHNTSTLSDTDENITLLC